MQHDEVVWQIINQGFCSFKTKIARERTFCQNPYNVTGLCLRSACPLANSSYATIREEEGIVYLFIKTVERAHSPKNLWEKIQLPANYTKALEIVSSQLEYFPKYLVHRNKQRLTKIHQMLIRMRRLKLKARPKLVTVNTKVEQREKGRERKALKAAQLDRAIEKELLERLKQVTDNEIYNYPEQQYNKVINKASDKYREDGEEELEDPDEEIEEEDGEEEDGEEEDGEEEEGEEENPEYEVEEEEEEDGELNVEYIEDFEPSDEEDDEEEDVEDVGSLRSRFSMPSMSYYSKSSVANSSSNGSSNNNKRKMGDDTSATSDKRSRREDRKGKANSNNKKRGARVEIEYEHEEEEAERATAAADSSMDFNF